MANFNYDAAIKAGATREQIDAYLAKRRKEGVDLASGAPVSTKPTSLLGSNKVLDAIAGTTGGKQVAKLGGALAFMGSKEKKAADKSQQQLGQLTQKFVKDTLAKYPPGDPRRERALKMAGQGYQDTSSFQNDVANTGPNGREVAADVGKLALTAVGMKVPANFAGKAALTRSSLAQVPLAAAHGALEAAEKGRSGGDVARSAAVSGATAGLTRGAMGLGGRLFNFLTKSAPEAVYKVSTRVPNKTDASLLLEEGVTGGRNTLKQKAQDLVADAGQKISKTPAIDTTTATADDIFAYKPLQRLQEQARRVGELEAVDKAIAKVLPKPTAVPEVVAPAIQGAEDELATLMGKVDLKNPSAVAGVAQKSKDYLAKASPFSIREALAQKQAIDATSSPGVFTDKVTSLGARAEGEVADAIRSIVGKKTPEVSSELSRQAAAKALLKELENYQNAKSSPVPYAIGNFLQRTLFHPAVATPLAQLGYNLGKPARSFAASKGGEAIRRAALQLMRGGIAKAGS
jgi:hypothetical protein